MRSLTLFLLLVVFLPARADDPAPFEIREGDRVVLLGDALLERENTYGYLETRMHEQFPDRKFIVRNLSWAGDTPRGWSRASFDPPEKGFERLKEAIALVKPTVVFLGYGMAASLQEMTDRAQDITLNRDEARYGSEPMSAARFKKEMAELMDAISQITGTANAEGAENAEGRRGSKEAKPNPSAPLSNPSAPSALNKPVPPATGVRFVLLSPIRHEDLRAVRPGLPDPAPHNALLEQYSKAIEELAKEKGARFVNIGLDMSVSHAVSEKRALPNTDDGVHLHEVGNLILGELIAQTLGADLKVGSHGPSPINLDRLRAAVLKKNDLFFHRFRPENATYLFGFRKHEQGQNAAEIPKFDPLIEAADAEIDRIKRNKPAASSPAGPQKLFAAASHPAESPVGRSESSLALEESPLVSSESSLASEESSLVSPESSLASEESSLVRSESLPNRPESLPNRPESLPNPSASVHHQPESVHRQPESVHRQPESIHRQPESVHRQPESIHRQPESIHRQSESTRRQEESLHYPAESVSACSEVELGNALAEATPLSAAGQPPKDPQIAQIPADSKENAGRSSDNLRQSASRAERDSQPEAARRGRPEGSSKSADTPPPLPDFTVADGYQIDLWAQNPLLEKPTQMNWDALGRLWVCSSSLYPQIEPGQPANDKILIIEDTDRDGKADKSSVFAEGLLIPTAVVPDLVSTAKTPRRQGSDGTSPPSESLRLGDLAVTPAACYVGQSTELLRFEDTDGDGKADTRRVVFSGFGTEDTHHLIHTLKWGPDGRLYWNQSIYIHSHLETPWGMVRLNSGGIFAYDPRTERVEVYAKGWCNPWGHAWDQWGQSFTTDGAGGQGVSWVIPGAMYFTYENARRICPSISPGNYPKFCSLELIHSPMFPDDWQGNAVTNDFRAHRIVRFAIEDLSAAHESHSSQPSHETDGKDEKNAPALSGYTTKEMPDLVRTNDQSFRPIDIRLGPDGALYVADWSNPVINHGEVDFRDPRRDHHMGRIWRISKKDTPPVKWEPLVAKANAELLEKLLSKSAWEQQGARAVVAARQRAQRNGQPDKSDYDLGPEYIGNPFREWVFAKHRNVEVVLADMWLSGNAFYGAYASLEPVDWFKELNSSTGPSEKARQLPDKLAAIWARELGKELRGVRAIETRQGKQYYGYLVTLIANDNPRVRVEAMRALSRIPTAQSAALVLEAAMKSPGESGAINARGEEKGGQFDKPTFSDTKDPHYGYAAWLSINDLAKPWTDAIASGAWKADTAERQQQLAWGLRAIDPALAGATISRLFSENKIPLDGTGPWIELLGQAGGAKELRGLLDKLAAAQLPPDAEPRALAALSDAARLRNARPEGELRHALDRYLPHATDAKDAKAEEKENPSRPSRPSREAQSAALRLLGAWKAEDAVIDSAAAMDTKTPAEIRFASIDALRSIGSPSSLNLLETLTRPDQDVNIRRAALVAITQVKLDAGVVKAADVLPAITDENAALETWRALLAVKGAPEAFAVKLPRDLPKPVATAGVRAAREAGKNGAKLLAALTPLAGISDAEAKMPKDFKALAAQTKQNGDPARGELIYRRVALTCTVCHSIGGAGGKVGPDMTSLGASAPLDYIIESTLNPTVKVKEGYNAVTLTLKDGTQAVGVQTRETPEEVFLRDATGREQRVPKAQIASTANLGSLMPVGLTDQLQDRERLDLFAFLGELGKPGPYDASKGNVARAWRLFSGNDVEKVVKGDAALDTALPGYTLVDGRFVKELLEAAAPIAANGAPTMLAVAQFQSSGGKTRLALTGAEKVWLDGQPLAIVGELAPELSGGMHTLVVKLDVKQLPPVLRAESPDARFLGN